MRQQLCHMLHDAGLEVGAAPTHCGLTAVKFGQVTCSLKGKSGRVGCIYMPSALGESHNYSAGLMPALGPCRDMVRRVADTAHWKLPIKELLWSSPKTVLHWHITVDSLSVSEIGHNLILKWNHKYTNTGRKSGCGVSFLVVFGCF